VIFSIKTQAMSEKVAKNPICSFKIETVVEKIIIFETNPAHRTARQCLEKNNFKMIPHLKRIFFLRVF
jgi:hypothetical protein